MIDLIDLKYFKLAVGTLKKETPNDVSLDCPVCEDTKGRLHMYKKDSMETPLIRCFNAGCSLEDHQGLVNFLNFISPQLSPQYKREKFNRNIERLSGKSGKGPSLNDILKGIKTTSYDSESPEIEPSNSIQVPKKERKIPDLFLKDLLYAKDVPEAVKYVEGRNLKVQDDWLFSKNKFINIFDKNYFVENFLFIPLWQNNHLRGFYTRCISYKQFSTIIFPKGEKYWVNEGFNEDETCYIFEGIIDALSSGLDNIGAMLGADLPEEFLENLKDPIFCFDFDETGIKKALKYNSLGYKTFVWPSNIEEKDMNGLLKFQSLEDNKKMILGNIFEGLLGKVKLNLIKF